MNTFSVKHNLQKLIFVSENIFATTFHVTIGAIFASFNCYIYFGNSVLFPHFLWINKSFLAISETLLKRCFRNPKAKFLFIISIVSNICLVNNLRSQAFVVKWAIGIWSTIATNSDVFVYKLFLLCADNTDATLTMQLSLTFNVLLLKILCRGFSFGKYLFTSLKSIFLTSVFTFNENKGLNHITFLLRFFFSGVSNCFVLYVIAYCQLPGCAV